MKPCKLYEIPDYENSKATQPDWREGEYIHMVGGIFLNAVGNNGNDKDWNSPVWLPYEEPKDDNAIEELTEEDFTEKSIEDTSWMVYKKQCEIIRHINKENNAK